MEKYLTLYIIFVTHKRGIKSETVCGMVKLRQIRDIQKVALKQIAYQKTQKIISPERLLLAGYAAMANLQHQH